MQDSLSDTRILQLARRYEALVSDERVLVWAMDTELRPTGPNPAWERYTGQTRQEYLELGWLEAIRESDRDRCLREIESNVACERAFGLELAIRRYDGVYRRHSIRAIPVRNEHGMLVEWIGTAADVEADRAAGDQLRDMDERLRATYEAASVGTWEWFPENGELRWSPEMYRMLGIDPQQVRPSVEAWISSIHPADVAMATRDWVDALEHSDAFSQEFRVVRPDGAVRWLLSRASINRDDSGRVVRVLGLDMDVTERRAIEDQMRAALGEHSELRERLVALTDGAEGVLRAETLADVRAAICDLAARALPADGYALWSLDTDTGTWSVVHSRGLGEDFVSERLPGAEVPFGEPLVADELSGELLAHRAGAYRDEGIQSLISVPLAVSGVRRGALSAYYRAPHHTTPAERQVAVAVGHLAAAALGNAEARARQELMRVEAERHSRRMAFLADASVVLSTLDFEASFKRLAELAVPSLGDWCVIDVERDGQLSRVAVAHPDPEKLLIAERLNERFSGTLDQSTGIGRALITGKSELYPDIQDEQLVAGARDEEQLRDLRALDIRSVIVSPLITRGRTLGVLTLVSSTSGRRYDETDLRFVELVARRAAMAIDNARLYEEARVANQAKDEFLALLSHELRTPLNAIMGWTQILMNPTHGSGIDPATARGLAIIQRNAKLQAELVEGLLDVARVATGGLPLSRQVIDVGESAGAALEAIRPVATERGVTVHLVAGPGARISADPNRLQQILSNLLSNAVKFTEAGGRIEVRVRENAGWCELAVADTGAGIARDFLPHVFERFRQADSSSTRRHGGLGLGLWLVQELVKAHGGTIRAASPGPGQGSTFTIRLPLVR